MMEASGHAHSVDFTAVQENNAAFGHKFLPGGKSHLHPVLRPQRYHRLQTDLLFGIEAEPPFSSQCGQQQNPFRPRKPLADAPARAAAEREVDVLLARLFDRLRFPALRDEFRYVYPESCIVVRDIRAKQDQ